VTPDPLYCARLRGLHDACVRACRSVRNQGGHFCVYVTETTTLKPRRFVPGLREVHHGSATAMGYLAEGSGGWVRSYSVVVAPGDDAPALLWLLRRAREDIRDALARHGAAA
jgi:hypothetical protein